MLLAWEFRDVRLCGLNWRGTLNPLQFSTEAVPTARQGLDVSGIVGRVTDESLLTCLQPR